MFIIEPGVSVLQKNVVHNPDDDFFIEFLKPYYVVTKDGQYLFGSTQPGRRPDRAFYMVPQGYRLGKKQKKFDTKKGKRIYEIAMSYIENEKPRVIVQDGIQGEQGYEVGLRVVISIRNPHSAYIAWMGKMMIFPPKKLCISIVGIIFYQVDSLMSMWKRSKMFGQNTTQIYH